MHGTSLVLAALALALLPSCGDSAPLSTECLVALELEGGALAPAFSTEVTSYAAEVSLLAHHVQLRGVTDTGRVLTRTAPLALGDNELELVLGGARYTVTVTRRPEPWRTVQVLGLEPPVENAYFGDYLRASERYLYVNASRRGRLYRKEAGAWRFERPSEELVVAPLEWMFEAALSDDTLAFVAEPAGGAETLFAFSIEADGPFVPAGEHVTNDQGTLRLAGDELVFVNAERIDVLRREGGIWALAQSLPAPAAGIGFALRPTYFDAPGVSFADGVLVVGAPLASMPAVPGAAPNALECDATEPCAYESGAVLVYERDEAGVYRGPAVLRAPAPASGQGFGHATALDGALLAVGAPRDGGPGASLPESGAVYVFRRAGGKWHHAQTLSPAVARAYDYFGDSLVVTGDVVLAGAPGQDRAFGASAEDASAPDSGGVFAFVSEGGTFRELGLHQLPGELAPPFPFPDAFQRAGSALAAASNTAPGERAGEPPVANAGRAYFLSW